jgi:hypothetical protein
MENIHRSRPSGQRQREEERRDRRPNEERKQVDAAGRGEKAVRGGGKKRERGQKRPGEESGWSRAAR